MYRCRSRITGLVLALVAHYGFAASPAGADTYVGGAGGALVPYSGATGWTVLLEMGTDWTNKYVRVGGEVIFGNLSQEIDLRSIGGGKVDVDMRTYELRFVTRYVMFPGKISPYLGVGVGLIVVDLDDAAVSRGALGTGLVRTNGKVGFGGGLDGLLGLEVPLFSKSVNLFGEARAQYSWEFTSNLAPVTRSENYSGISGIVGLRARY